MWLKSTRGTYLDDLSSERSRELFDKFVKRYNTGKLEDVYYKEGGVTESTRTRHKWAFVDKLSIPDSDALSSTKDAVASSTNCPESAATAQGSAAVTRPQVKPRLSRKREREQYNLALDEIAPKATGREAAIDARRSKAARIHGAARDREDETDGLNIHETVTMGNSEADLQQRLQRRELARKRKSEVRDEKFNRFAEKEQSIVDDFRRQIKGKIVIAPRT